MADIQNFTTFGACVRLVLSSPSLLHKAHDLTPPLVYSHLSSRSRCCATDAFADAKDDSSIGGGKVHIRVQQRNGRKCLTTVQGLADDLDIKRILKAFKKNFSCNGALVKDEELGEIIQLSGDQRTNIREFLIDQEICADSQLVLHGF